MTSKEYFKDKMRDYRKQNPLSQKNWVYVVKCNDKKYAFLNKRDIQIERINMREYNMDTNIINMF